jgi:hypothetical protein
MLSPDLPNQANQYVSQNDRTSRRYKRRWTAERTIRWLQHYRGLFISWANPTSLSKVYFILLALFC